jgi:hypothetical protein
VVRNKNFLFGLCVTLFSLAVVGCGDDEPAPKEEEACTKHRYYADLDHDGLGDPDDSVRACERPDDHVDNKDDTDPNCAGQHVFYEDQDGDGLGDPTRPVEACTMPEGAIDNHDDAEPDCATNDSDECGVCAGPGPRIRYADADGDGLGDPDVSIELCDRPSGWVNNDRDPEPDCATDDTDDCGVCGGENASRDCAGVCDGEATLDGCERCSGGTTGLDAAVEDTDGDGIPNVCDLCIADGVPRVVVQWTEINPYGTVFGGPYTFQVVLFETGDFAFAYRNVQPFGDASVTVGHQAANGVNAVELAYGSRYPTAYPIVYFRRKGDRVAVEYTVPLPWYDIRATGTPLLLSDDSDAPVALPFGFPYAGATHSSLRVSANGLLGLSAPFGTYDNLHLPAASLGALLAPFWDDLVPGDGGSIRYQFLDGSCEADCHGDFGGVATVDTCEKCAGGNSPLVPDADRDCNGDCSGGAYLDTCRRCVGGNTGRDPSDPGTCPTGPDMLVDASYLRDTVEEAVVDVPTNSCLLNENCVTGTGRRRVVRFGTRIANIGNRDVVVGTPSDTNPLWEWDPCHGHYHYEDYADYDLIDVLTSTTLPIGTKNGFCVLDLETWDPDLAVNGCNTYDCNYQGISVGCADVYDSALQCQWIDITGIANGDYDLRVTVNPAQRITELDYGNNAATVRIHISDTDVTLVPQ